MSAMAAQTYPRLLAYLAGAYVTAAAAMAPFAGNQEEVFAFGAWVWAIPALLAFAFRNKSSFVDRYRWSALCLLAIILLAWAVGLTFQATY